MSPIYEEEGKVTLEDLLKMKERNQCKECGGRLNVFQGYETGLAYLACNDWNRTHHEGIEREPSRYEKEGLASLNIKTRREIMEQKHGPGMTTALDKARVPMTGALTQPQAMHILKLVYPNVPESEIIRTAILCRDFGLHPLMKEVYIIGFKNTKTGMTDYSTVVGITASRKMAADRKGAYSFVDGSPRAATSAEIIKQYGKDSEEERDNLISICILKGEKGNEATGFGLWPKNKEPYGTDKGNTKRNMANIRSERPAYNRLPGAALPPLEVIDEAYAEVPDVGKVDKATGEIYEGEFTEVEEEPKPDFTEISGVAKEHWCKEHNCYFEKKTRGTSTWYAHKLASGGWCNEDKKKGNTVPEAQASIQPSEVPTLEPAPDVALICSHCAGYRSFPSVEELKEHIRKEHPAEAGTEQEHQQPKRDPETIKTINELYRACNEDFKLQPAQVIRELGVNCQSDISDTPADCYRRISAVR